MISGVNEIEKAFPGRASLLAVNSKAKGALSHEYASLSGTVSICGEQLHVYQSLTGFENDDVLLHEDATLQNKDRQDISSSLSYLARDQLREPVVGPRIVFVPDQ